MKRYVYIAACLEDAGRARAYAAALAEVGHVVVSTWHRDPGNTRAIEHALAADRRREIATTNCYDLECADALVWLADARGRGSLVELGIAVGRKTRVVAVGDPATVTLMACVPGVRWVATAADALAALEAA